MMMMIYYQHQIKLQLKQIHRMVQQQQQQQRLHHHQQFLIQSLIVI